jgi:hypothetical protein
MGIHTGSIAPTCEQCDTFHNSAKIRSTAVLDLPVRANQCYGILTMCYQTVAIGSHCNNSLTIS